MRNAQKQEVLGCIESLHQAHEEIKNALNGGNYSLVQNMLSQCQEFAVSLGENIEKLEGEGHATVACLEEYCETLYHVYEKLGSGGAGSSKIYKKLRRQLLKVESSAGNDIRVRKEVVFLPYKASMWDSLESVWKAADEDPDCDAYVIPIPYYDKNPDRSFREKHYEGEQYPEYVPVVSYESYDFEKRRPDMIFIHNPYDECNYVTSVEPFFYSKNLKQFTEKLVYIPYFILGEIKPDNRQAVEGMKHFCLAPGVMNADKVIVQSEDMRQVYINVLAEAFGEQTRGYWEEKILGLGSPKVDKVLGTKKEDLVIPKEWRRIIEKPDGSWKKIVLYNTSVNALLQHNEKMLEKIRDVLRVFWENRDEVTLLWRPHPLIKATISSMRPQLWAEYEKIVGKYREDVWGIYDDTDDLDRAVCLSDAYYGDGSSVVQLCQTVQKTVMLQNVQDVKEIAIVDAVKVDDTIWLCPANFNCLFATDINTGKVVGAYNIPSAIGYVARRSFGAMVSVGRKIYFSPFHEHSIMQFEIDPKKFTSIKLDENLLKNKKEFFMGIGVYHQYIFFMSVSAPAIIRLDTTDNSIVYIGDWLKKMENLIFDHQDAYFRKQCILVGDKLYAPFCNANAVLEINCKDLETTVYKLGDEKEGYSGICLSEGELWLSPRKGGKLVKWNIGTGAIDRFEIPNHDKVDLSYIGIVNQQERKLLLASKKKGRSFVIEKEKVSVLDGEYDFMQEDKDVLMFYERISHELTLYDKEHDVKRVIRIAIEKNDIDIMKLYKESEKPFVETSEVDVSQLSVIIENEQSQGYLLKNVNNGEKIYKCAIGDR